MAKARMTLNKTRIQAKRFGEFIRSCRIEKGKSQTELGAYIGLSRIAVMNRELGREDWTLKQALDSLEFLEKDPKEAFIEILT